MPSNSTYMCIPCRSGNGCLTKQHETIYMGRRWRAPKRTNDRAWKMIEAGDVWWDKKALAKKKGFSHAEWTKDYLWKVRMMNPKYKKSGLTDP